jgi:hypothetical protein
VRTNATPVLAVLALALPLTACSERDVFHAAEAAEQSGNLGEAAEKYELVCAYTPLSPRCAEADGRAFEARMKAADTAIGEGRYLAADRALRHAVLTADEAGRKRALDRLAQADVVQGAAFERALLMGDRKATVRALNAVVASGVPAAAKAKEWLAKEGPIILAQAVKDACGPEHDGSCTVAFAELKAAGAAGAAVEDATLAFEKEKERVKPLLGQADNFLSVYASQGKKLLAMGKCVTGHAADGTDANVIRTKCEEEAFGTEPDEKRYQTRKTTDDLFRRLLKRIGDPALIKEYQSRKARALAEGEVPAPAPRSP